MAYDVEAPDEKLAFPLHVRLLHKRSPRPG
jgi:hypothetical protein